MAAKNSMSTLAAKAVAKVKEQKAFTGQWGTAEHLTFIRHMANEALTQALKATEKEADAAKRLVAIGESLNSQLKEAFKADPEIGYASNFEKLLVKAGELSEGGEYE